MNEPIKLQEQMIADAALRRMDHATWMLQFAIILEMANARREQAGKMLTPVQLGTVNRLRLAVKYIELLQREARDDQKLIKALQLEIEQLKEDAKAETEEGR